MTVNSKGKGTPYIKPTRYKHDSGYRTFEVGYILEMNPNNTVKEKKVLGQHSDDIFTDYAQLYNNEQRWSLNMDLTMDGYIRLFSHQGKLKWDMEEWASSSMGLELYEHKQVASHIEADLKGLAPPLEDHERDCQQLYIEAGYGCVCGADKRNAKVKEYTAAIERYCRGGMEG